MAGHWWPPPSPEPANPVAVSGLPTDQPTYIVHGGAGPS
jgi:hypothetical protein